MLNKHAIIFLFFCFSLVSYSQEDVSIQVNDSIKTEKKEMNPLAPSKAAFYSAVLPGLGQAYNKKYWKIPIVYGALGTGIFFYVRNDKQYDRFRTAYKNRLAGLPDEFTNPTTGEELLSNDALIDAQKFYSRNKEISLLVTIGLYVLNIIDANVDAHLMQYNVSEDLSISPDVKINEFDRRTNLGLTLNYSF
ncbi:MAG: hypothetical protein HRT68_17065 [Flavobacteriaceae bacterium]|nr:hypothetical protein [Flavobacteriaceae bacterium]